VVSRTLWETRFNGADDIIGRTVSLGGEPYTVVGVLGDLRRIGARWASPPDCRHGGRCARAVRRAVGRSLARHHTT
jgi:hypothetical protein